MTDLYVFLLFLCCIGSTVHGQSLRIFRFKNDPDDYIQLPSVQSECPTITNPLCDKYNARRIDVSHGCWCQCNQPSGNYTFFEPNNSCIRVSEARQQAGKKFENRRKRLSLFYLIGKKVRKLLSPSIFKNNSRYWKLWIKALIKVLFLPFKVWFQEADKG